MTRVKRFLKGMIWVFQKVWIDGRNPEDLIYRDELTGLLSRPAILATRDNVVRRAVRTGDRVCFVVIDLDKFKTVNDQEGHRAGDRLLASVGDCLRACCRDSDYAGRVGGDEFLLILEHTKTEEAHEIVETRVKPALSAIQASFSYGIACFHWEDLLASLMHEADLEMYQQKKEKEAQAL